MKGWEDKARDTVLQYMMMETIESVQQDDPARGNWCVDSKELNVLVDASSLAIGATLEWHETVLKDTCWLRPEADTQHINLAELDAVLKGINLALQWQGEVLHIKTDSVCLYHWISDTLTGKACVRTKAASEMLITRQVSTFKELVKEYALTVDVTLVLLTQNITDRLTRVPQRWFEAMKKENRPKPLIGAAHLNKLDASQIMAIHRGSGHPGVQHTTYFIRRICPTIAKAAVRSAIWMCAYALARNGITVQCHHMVKRIAARMRCPIQEAVYWYNITPRDISPSTAPANRIYCYEVGVKEANHVTASLGTKHSSHQVRDRVWFKAPQS